jgi:hypothetical protein
VEITTTTVDIEAIKCDRAKYVESLILALRAASSSSEVDFYPTHFCDSCGAQFDALPIDAKYCPRCCGTDIRVLSRLEKTDYETPLDRIGITFRATFDIATEEDRQKRVAQKEEINRALREKEEPEAKTRR